MATLMGITASLQAIFRTPFHILLVFGIKLRARFWTFIRQKLQYRDLGENELRLLSIHPPRTDRHDEPVRCSLDRVPLNHTPEYQEWEGHSDPQLRLQKKIEAWVSYVISHQEGPAPLRLRRYNWGDYAALSYAWGSGLERENIIVNGQLVSVTRSLASALRTVRLEPRTADSALRLWVDALCINQDDPAERGREIRRMRQIYGDSCGVFVHLGVEKDDSDSAMALIRKIAYNLREGFDYRTFLTRMSNQVVRGESSLERESYIALFKLFCRPYWSRMWIIQELAMGGDDTVISCGRMWAPLHEVRQVMKLLLLNFEQFSLIIGPHMALEHIEEFQSTTALLWMIARLRDLSIVMEDQANFTYAELRTPILSVAQMSNATDARDKVYGLLGLLPTKLVLRIDRREENYLLSTKQIFLNFAKAIIEVTRELDLIFSHNLRQRTMSKLELPSWAPDLTLNQDRSEGKGSHERHFGNEDERYQTSELSNRPLVGEISPCRSDSGREPHIRFSNDDKLLFCQGFCIGNIEGMAPEVAGVAVSTKPDWIVQPQTSQSPYGDPSENVNALLRTLLLNPTGDLTMQCTIFQLPWFGDEADSDAASGSFNLGADSLKVINELSDQGWDALLSNSAFTTFESFRRRIGLFRVGNRPFKDYFPHEITPCHSDTILDALDILVASIVAHRLVTTRTGHIGFAPATVEPGDEIYILLGSSLPVILRPVATSEGYEVIGECYVDGFMKGEAIEALDAGEYQLQEIALC